MNVGCIDGSFTGASFYFFVLCIDDNWVILLMISHSHVMQQDNVFFHLIIKKTVIYIVKNSMSCHPLHRKLVYKAPD